MRICRVSISYPTSKSPGAGLVAYYLSKYIEQSSLYLTLKRAGKAYIMTSNHVNIQFIDVALRRSSNNLNKQIHNHKLSFIQRFMVYVKLVFSGRGVPFLVRSIPRMIRFNPDIVCCHANLTIYHGIFANIFLRKKFVLHIHAMSDAIAICNLHILRVIVKKASRIYCISGPVRDKLSSVINEQKLFLTSTGVDPDVFHDLSCRREKLLIQVGQFMWYKGHKYLLESMPIIIKKHPDCKLILIGDGDLRQEIIEQVNDLGLEDYVKLIPTVSQNKLCELYNKSTLMVMPSLYEGLPKVLLESFACGLPAVITDACNAEDISVDRAIVVPKKSSRALSDAVCSLLDDELKWKLYSKNCRSIINTHNWKFISERIYEDYCRIIAID